MWKKSEVWKNRKFQILLLAELLLLLLGIVGLFRKDEALYRVKDMQVSLSGGAYAENTGYSVAEGDGVSGDWLVAEGITLEPGVYRLEIDYKVDRDGVGVYGIYASEVPYYGLLSNGVSMYSGITESECQFYVTSPMGPEEKLRVMVEYDGGGELSVQDITIVKTNAGSRILLFCVILCSCVINSLVMIYVYMGKYQLTREWKLIHFGIPALALLASFPIFTDYIINGADSGFHILRMEFLAKSIAEGIIPARVEPMWLYGHGYASSLFYCDTFLWIPALLRLIGLPMLIAYGGYVLFVNFSTAIISYISFKGMFQNKLVGMFGCMLYTLAPYRIYNIYNRGAVGEYTAMIFLPLVCYGFYLLLAGDVKSKQYRYYWLVLVLGFSGIIQSHVLTCEMMAGAAVILCILCIKRVFRKETFFGLVKAVVGTILVNLWFLLPFLDMMASGKYKFSQNSGMKIQHRGILLANIFYTMQNAGGNSRFHEYGLVDTEPFGLGIAILIGVGVYLLIRREQKENSRLQDRTAMTAFVIGVIMTVMSTSYFPWDNIQEWNGITGMLVPMLQFPTRLSIVVCVSACVVACVAALWMLQCDNRRAKLLFFAGSIIACIGFSMYQTNDTLFSRDGFLKLHSAEGAGHSGILGAEYLPLDVEFNFHYHDAWTCESVTVVDYEKENLDTMTTVTVAGKAEEEHWIELPMLYYKGYQAEDARTGEALPVVTGTNGHVRVMLENGYEGTVHAWYAGMWYWRVAEVISVISVLGMLFYYGKIRKPEKE